MQFHPSLNSLGFLAQILMQKKNNNILKKRKQKKEYVKAEFPWRIEQTHWTDTLFKKTLLKNPARMTNSELAEALEEHNTWRRGIGKYYWVYSPLEEHAEMEAPFSPDVIGRFLDEAIARLIIIGDLTEGRFKKGSPLCHLKP